MNTIKLVVIGGGSSYTPELVEGVINNYNTLPVRELIFVDVPMGEEKVRINTQFIKRMIHKAKLNIEVSYTFDRKNALKDADFVMTQLRVGGLKARSKDEHIPLKYNVIGQETTGPGGFAKALRTIPVMMDICKDMEEVCPDAWLINFTNPSGIVTEALNKYTKIKNIGLCNVPIGMHYDIAERLEVDPKEISCNVIGLNHLSFVNKVYYKGDNVISKALEVKKKDGIVQNISKIDVSDFIAQKLGLVLSPYLQYFFFEKEMLEKELQELKDDKGTRADQVQEVEHKLFELYEDESLDHKPDELSKRGGARYSEAAINLINSIYNNVGDIQVVNVMNNGSIADLPDDASVEVNCVINKQGATPVTNGHLPLAVKGLVQHVKAYEQLTVEAAITGDYDTALLALISNPLVHDAEAAKNILDDLLEAHKEYLPQFNK